MDAEQLAEEVQSIRRTLIYLAARIESVDTNLGLLIPMWPTDPAPHVYNGPILDRPLPQSASKVSPAPREYDQRYRSPPCHCTRCEAIRAKREEDKGKPYVMSTGWEGYIWDSWTCNEQEDHDQWQRERDRASGKDEA